MCVSVLQYWGFRWRWGCREGGTNLVSVRQDDVDNLDCVNGDGGMDITVSMPVVNTAWGIETWRIFPIFFSSTSWRLPRPTVDSITARLLYKLASSFCACGRPLPEICSSARRGKISCLKCRHTRAALQLMAMPTSLSASVRALRACSSLVNCWRCISWAALERGVLLRFSCSLVWI